MSSHWWIYVPVFDDSGDQETLDAYAKFGFKVVPVMSQDLATQGQGGIHCITINYSPAPVEALFHQLDATLIKEAK